MNYFTTNGWSQATDTLNLRDYAYAHSLNDNCILTTSFANKSIVWTVNFGMSHILKHLNFFNDLLSINLLAAKF